MCNIYQHAWELLYIIHLPNKLPTHSSSSKFDYFSSLTWCSTHSSINSTYFSSLSLPTEPPMHSSTSNGKQMVQWHSRPTMASMWPLRSQATSLPMLTPLMKRVPGSTSTLLIGEVARADAFGEIMFHSIRINLITSKVFSNLSQCS